MGSPSKNPKYVMAYGRKDAQYERYDNNLIDIIKDLKDGESLINISGKYMISPKNLKEWILQSKVTKDIVLNVYRSKRNAKLGKMAENGYLYHTMTAATGASAFVINREIGRDPALESAMKRGYHWRQNHSILEWPDYIVNNTLVGVRTKWFDKLPFAKGVIIPKEPLIVNNMFPTSTQIKRIYKLE